MPVTVLGTSVAANADTTTTITASHTLAAGSNRRVVVVATMEASTRTFAGATYGGVTMTEIAALENVGSNALHVIVFEVVEADLPADGSNNAVVTISDTGISTARIRVLCVQDADQATIAAAQIASASDTSSAANSPISDDLTSITDGYIIAGGVVPNADNTSITFAGGTLGTEVEHEGANGVDVADSNHNTSSIPVTAGGTTTVSFSHTEGGASAHAMIAVCFSPAAAGGEVGGGSAGMPTHQHVHHPATNVTIFMRERLRKVGNLFVPDRRVLVPVGIRL